MSDYFCSKQWLYSTSMRACLCAKQDRFSNFKKIFFFLLNFKLLPYSTVQVIRSKHRKNEDVSSTIVPIVSITFEHTVLVILFVYLIQEDKTRQTENQILYDHTGWNKTTKSKSKFTIYIIWYYNYWIMYFISIILDETIIC